jgi:hypothetical protein
MENDSMTDRQEAYHNATICGARPKLMIDCIARKIPRLKECDIRQGEVEAPAGPSGIHLVAKLYFDSLDAINVALASPRGQAQPAIFPTLRTGVPSSTFLMPRTSERGRTKYAGLGRCWLIKSYVSAEALEDGNR